DDQLLCHLRRQLLGADAEQAGVGENLNDQPAVKRERVHRRLVRQRQHVHRIRAEMWRQRNGIASPFDDPRSDFFDFHNWFYELSATSTPLGAAVMTGRITGTAIRMSTNADTCNSPAIRNTGP